MLAWTEGRPSVSYVRGIARDRPCTDQHVTHFKLFELGVRSACLRSKRVRDDGRDAPAG